MDPNAPNPSLELDPPSTGISPVPVPPATAAAVIHPNPFFEKEEEERKVLRKARPKAMSRTDHDRPHHMTRARSLKRVLARASLPLVHQSFEAMLMVHKDFSRVKKKERERAAEWKVARRSLVEALARTNHLLVYCAQVVRKPEPLSWTGPVPIDEIAVQARLKRLLNGFLPSEVRADPSNLKETVQHLAQVLVRDPEEAGRWDPAFVEAVRQGALTLEQALDEVGERKQAHGEALTRLRQARAQWDFCWSVFERVVTGYFALKGKKESVAEAFRPIRLRRKAPDGGQGPPEPETQ